MQTETRNIFSQYLEQVGQLNGVNYTANGDSISLTFNVEPSVQQKLIEKQRESADFLTRINVVPVDELKGEKLGLGVTQTIASRTDTSGGGRRQPKDPSGMDGRSYECFQTNYDTMLSYGKLDMWAKFPDFATRISSQIAKASALDMITIGFNGETAEATTDPVVNSLLQDVNIGWLEKQRLEAAARVMDGSAGAKVANQVGYGAGADADYANLDALVYDATHNLLASWASEDTELVAMVSRDLLHDKYFPQVNQSHDPENTLALQTILATKQIGGLPAVRVPRFPAGTIFITRYDNLSIYTQSGKRRRHVKEEPEYNRVSNYESANDSYVIEDNDYACLIENITEVPA